MHPYDSGYGSRARSARIRAEHDDEATRLDSLRRRAAEPRGRSDHPNWLRAAGARIARLVGRPRRRSLRARCP